ncbi:TPA: hypothetical protein ENG04_04675 [Candidatus Poribacteria bacterium]|nr:hypothetical protein [Candidatus Poribacteria bacterium]HEX29356.1 hypothetical protein [Candidatus Poribacteria bacterium]
MIRVIFDSSSLITACKFTVDGIHVVKHLLNACEIAIPASVRDEVVVAGGSFPDAMVAKELIEAGKLLVLASSIKGSRVLDKYNLGAGEKECILLAEEQEDKNRFDFVVVDDRLAFVVCSRIKLRVLLLLDLFVVLVEERRISAQIAIKMVNAIAPRYGKGFIFHTLKMIEWGDRGCLR